MRVGGECFFIFMCFYTWSRVVLDQSRYYVDKWEISEEQMTV